MRHSVLDGMAEPSNPPSILNVKEVGLQPSRAFIVPDSIIFQAIALAQLQPHSITIGPAILDQLAALPPMTPVTFDPPPFQADPNLKGIFCILESWYTC